MPYLMRMTARPNDKTLTDRERRELARTFDMHAGEVFIHGEPVGWEEIEEVELVDAPVVGGLSSWLIGLFVDLEDRYHLGIYLKRDEAVLANLTDAQVRFALSAIAYYAPNPVRYNGPDGVAPVVANW